VVAVVTSNLSSLKCTRPMYFIVFFDSFVTQQFLDCEDVAVGVVGYHCSAPVSEGS
jgi:hypothetical protein